MKMPGRRVGLVLATLGTAGGLTVAGAVASSPAPGPPRAATSDDAAGTRLSAAGARLSHVEQLQERLRRTPGDWQGWAAIGNAYVEEARVSADPSSYGRAEAAFARSIELHPQDNAVAVTGQAALAAARHDFVDALGLARRAQELDDFNPPALGIESDALIELGRYDEAFTAIDRLNAMKPGVPAYSRASYAWELRGDLARATDAMELALDAAATPGQISFAAYQLGQLAFGSGDLEAAHARFSEGLRRDPGSAQLLAGRARVAAARGDVEAALRDYTASVQKVPQPGVVAELGDLYAALGRKDEAQEQYTVVDATQQLLVAAGQDVDLELSLFDADHGRPAEALRTAEAAYATRTSIFTEDALAWALHRNGRAAEALPHARAALALGTRSAVLHYHLGMIHSALGDRAAARRELEKALSINPYFSPLHAPVARAELATLSVD